MTFFVGYASEDRQEARKLYFELVGCGAKVWIDLSFLNPGDRIE